MGLCRKYWRGCSSWHITAFNCTKKCCAGVGLAGWGLYNGWSVYDNVNTNPNSTEGQKNAAVLLGILSILWLKGAALRFYQVRSGGGNVFWQQRALQVANNPNAGFRPLPDETPIIPADETAVTAWATAQAIIATRTPTPFTGVRAGESVFPPGMQVSAGGKFVGSNLRGIWAIGEDGNVRFAPNDSGHPSLFGGQANIFSAGTIRILGNRAMYNNNTGRGPRENILGPLLRIMGTASAY
jgi:hypothetical protein